MRTVVGFLRGVKIISHMENVSSIETKGHYEERCGVNSTVGKSDHV